jgi:hypothetical protein
VILFFLVALLIGYCYRDGCGDGNLFLVSFPPHYLSSSSSCWSSCSIFGCSKNECFVFFGFPQGVHFFFSLANFLKKKNSSLNLQT